MVEGFWTKSIKICLLLWEKLIFYWEEEEGFHIDFFFSPLPSFLFFVYFLACFSFEFLVFTPAVN